MRCFQCDADLSRVTDPVQQWCPLCGKKLAQCATCDTYDNVRNYTHLYHVTDDNHFRGRRR